MPIREVSTALGADTITWCSETGTALVEDEGLTLSAQTGQTYVVANGRYLYISEGVQNIGGKIMLPVRVLCQAFGAQVEWNAVERAVYITTTGEPIESGDTYYDADDLYWPVSYTHLDVYKRQPPQSVLTHYGISLPNTEPGYSVDEVERRAYRLMQASAASKDRRRIWKAMRKLRSKRCVEKMEKYLGTLT